MKRYFYLAATLLLGMTFAACDGGNTPGKSEKTSLPAIVRSIKGLSMEEAAKKLEDLKFVRVEDEPIWVYPESVAKATTEEEARKVESMHVYFDEQENNSAIEAGQFLLSAEDALDAYRTWDKYLSGEISKPSVWMAMVQAGEEEGNEMYFMDGTLVDKFRNAVLTSLDAMLQAGRIDQARYDEYAKMYKSTHADYTKYLAGLKATDNFIIEESYVETVDAEKATGYITASHFENNIEENSAERVLVHGLLSGDISEMLDQFSFEAGAPAKAPKFHFPFKKK